MLVDLHAPYQTYADKLGVVEGTAVSFSTGSSPWGYPAAIGLGLGGDVQAKGVEVEITTTAEPVYLLMVDRDYQQVGERMALAPRAFTHRVSLPLAKGAATLIIQAGEKPNAAPVTLSGVTLQLV